ncbi:hypothetical protein Afil01_07770 [Actinorhabdospora filicis]|uniref:Uncharacterized protein n=1 Tax=Actinorhabdospora filicis TaxID=1785913 RepID=A0A9W6SF02_9ACTN|nr:hypothetical protein [Actinorhabdospora filicis]GLZ75970.1 hypothetical protein Afil01_07770 [Actinorhabdospora filicis]
MSLLHAAAPVPRTALRRALLTVAVIAAMLLGIFCAEQLALAAAGPDAGRAAVAIAPPGGGDGPCAPADHGPEQASRGVSTGAVQLSEFCSRASAPVPAIGPAKTVRSSRPVVGAGVSRLLAELCVWRT